MEGHFLLEWLLVIAGAVMVFTYLPRVFSLYVPKIGMAEKIAEIIAAGAPRIFK